MQILTTDGIGENSFTYLLIIEKSLSMFVLELIFSFIAGIGYETAKWIAMLGAHVIIACRSKERALHASISYVS